MKLLLVEDELELRSTIREYLTGEGYLIEVASNYYEGVEKMNLYVYDCIMLDITLPDGNGLDLLKDFRRHKRGTPVIMISAKDAVDDKILGLDLGADDYLAKPFHLAELHARIKSAIRRNLKKEIHSVAFENVLMYPENREVLISGQQILLNKKEYDILYYFLLRPSKLVQKSLLAESIWGDSVDQVDSLDFIYSQIKNLRKKLKDADANVDIIAVYGVGYKLVSK